MNFTVKVSCDFTADLSHLDGTSSADQNFVLKSAVVAIYDFVKHDLSDRTYRKPLNLEIRALEIGFEPEAAGDET